MMIIKTRDVLLVYYGLNNGNENWTDELTRLEVRISSNDFCLFLKILYGLKN